jgi:hypothetical protein
MHEDGGPELLGGGEKRLEARIADRDTFDMARQLDARKAQLVHDILELPYREIDVLHRHAA